MTYAEKLVNQAISVLKADVGDRTLERVTPLEGEETCWFFWFPEIRGCYEFALHEWQRFGTMEKTFFLLKYYPDVHDPVFQDFSCAEQIVRMSSCFKDQPDEDEAETSERLLQETGVSEKFLGIPQLQKRTFFDQDLFLVGKIVLVMDKDKLVTSLLETQTSSLKYSETGQPEDQSQQGLALVDGNDSDRKVNGLELCRPFYDFLVKELVPSMLFTTSSTEFYSSTSLISYKMEQSCYQNEYVNEVCQVELRNHYRAGVSYAEINANGA